MGWVVPRRNCGSRCRHWHALICEQYRQSTYQLVTVNRHILYVSLCVSPCFSLSVQGRCAFEWYLSFLWVQAHCPTVTVIHLTLNRHLHAHLTALSILITNTHNYHHWPTPCMGHGGCGRIMMLGCYTDEGCPIFIPSIVISITVKPLNATILTAHSKLCWASADSLCGPLNRYWSRKLRFQRCWLF